MLVFFLLLGWVGFAMLAVAFDQHILLARRRDGHSAALLADAYRQVKAFRRLAYRNAADWAVSEAAHQRTRQLALQHEDTIARLEWAAAKDSE